ncbi:predicted protein [Thalassiosira pseudonana CCMP1335]|uniref:Uncharacterized protein n=1 Tax=Thalassiosira pseudonana TaxID=35128 RepID=B8LDT6_THAPS|nr:predicted protein [Thalassiosira pseudonana CCMP1335]EED86540.1 predicted protein [Thalassiosira pseudonana CCMP1335]
MIDSLLMHRMTLLIFLMEGIAPAIILQMQFAGDIEIQEEEEPQFVAAMPEDIPIAITEPAVTTPAATPAPIIPEPTTPAPTICEGRNFYRDDDTGKCSNEVTGGTYGSLIDCCFAIFGSVSCPYVDICITTQPSPSPETNEPSAKPITTAPISSAPVSAAPVTLAPGSAPVETTSTSSSTTTSSEEVFSTTTSTEQVIQTTVASIVSTNAPSSSPEAVVTPRPTFRPSPKGTESNTVPASIALEEKLGPATSKPSFSSHPSSSEPTLSPSVSKEPTRYPTSSPSDSPTKSPSKSPSSSPTTSPSASPEIF